MLEKGILIIAIGHPYYGRMAYNLAISIKAVDKKAHISLVYTHDAISHIPNGNLWVFDNLIHYYNYNGNAFGIKLELDKLSPYQKTLYLDVDTLWVSKDSPNFLIDQFDKVAFTGITEGFHDYDQPEKSEHSKYYYFWADVEEIKTTYFLGEYGFNKIYQWRSEFLYFEKCDKVDKLFSYCREIYNNCKLKTLKLFADNIPDELAINIAAAKLIIDPHKYKWQPTFWDRLHGGACPPIDELSGKYYALSCGSNANSASLKRVYDRLMRAYTYKLGLQHIFPLINKKEMIAKRQLM